MVIFDYKFKVFIVNKTQEEGVFSIYFKLKPLKSKQNQKLTLVKRIDVVKTKYLSTHSPVGTDASGAIL